MSIANAAESLLKTKKTLQDRLAQQLRRAGSDNMAIKSEPGFCKPVPTSKPSWLLRQPRVRQKETIDDMRADR